jgi:RNA polymerase sigma-70 factor (ECF subfamily)
MPDRFAAAPADMTAESASAMESDEALMARIGRGNQAAFSILVGRHRARVVATAWRMTGNRSDGEEIAQEAFARVWLNAAKWRSAEEGGTARVGTWLYRVVFNLCIDRKRKVRWDVLDETMEIADESDDAARILQRQETAREVAAAVASLPERQRMALVLCFYEGMSNIEAAKILSLSVGAVESLLVRARRALKEKLAHLNAELADG